MENEGMELPQEQTELQPAEEQEMEQPAELTELQPEEEQMLPEQPEQTEEPAGEEKENKLQQLWCTAKEKCAALVQKLRALIPEKTAKEEAVEETATELTEDEPSVEENADNNTEVETCVEEVTENESAEEVEVEEMTLETAEEDTAVEETEENSEQEELSVEELFADEMPETVPLKKLKPLHLGLMIAGGVVLLALLVFVILHALGVNLKPKANDVLYHKVYTADDQKLEKRADTVIATLGDDELTVSELQLYYIDSIYAFYTQNQYYLDYMGLDMYAPLSEQSCTLDPTMTWEQYFLDAAVKNWQSYALVGILAEENGFVVSTEIQEQIDSMADQLESIAVAYGYADANDYLSTEMAPGVTKETYLHFNEVYYVCNEYLKTFYEQDYPTEIQIRNFYELNKETFRQNGIEPNMGLISDVRHILIQPIGGTVSEDGTETIYSEEEWATALSEATRILEAWKAGEATEDSFATMANTYSEDGGSNTIGGLYEAIDPFSSYVPEFLSWAVDGSRQVGDTDIVKTTYGYHIMYFVGGEDYFNYVVGEQLVADRIQQKLSKVKEEYTLDMNFKKVVLCEPLK